MTDHSAPSRREFLAASAIGLLGVAGLGREENPQSDSVLLYVGTYTEGKRDEGIFLVHMDRRTGALRQVGAVNAGANPSFLAIHPNGHLLFAVNEVSTYEGKPSGAVSAFAIDDATGALTRLGEQSSGGGAPCYVSVDRTGRAVLVANYVGGSVALLPVRDGALAGETRVVKHFGSGPNSERQEKAHAHCIIPDPSNRYALAADLGMDRVITYRLDIDKGAFAPSVSSAQLRPGAGPRHLAFHPTSSIVYVANELDSTVTALRFDATRGALTPLETYSCLPADWKGTSYVADIHPSRDGRHLYVSNRGHDSIAVFDVDANGALALKQNVSTAGNWPRNFAIDPSGRWVLVANQRSNSVVVLARDGATGVLSPTSVRLELPSPVCIRFASQRG